jgi:Tfp pilus assembly protein PilW
MITTTRSPNRPEARRRAARGFSIIEVMIGGTLAAIILAGTLSTFLFLGRSGANLRNYNDMEAQARKSLEIFAEDTRQASSVTWTSENAVTLVVNAANVYYTYSSGNFIRKTSSGITTLLTGITSFNFSAYDINGAAITDFSTATARTTANNATKQVQISLSAARSTQTVTKATNIVLSARYVLRNKKVTA